jgi:hypothetical protein
MWLGKATGVEVGLRSKCCGSVAMVWASHKMWGLVKDFDEVEPEPLVTASIGRLSEKKKKLESTPQSCFTFQLSARALLYVHRQLITARHASATTRVVRNCQARE